MLQAIFIPRSQREEQGASYRKCEGFTEVFPGWIPPQAPYCWFRGKGQQSTETGDLYSSLCLPWPGTVNPVLSLALLDFPQGSGWLSIPQILSRTGCLPPSLTPTPGFPGSAKRPSNSLTLRSLLVCTVFEFIISSRKRHRAGRSVNTQTNHIFPIVLRSGLCDVVAVETVGATAVHLRTDHFIHSLLLTHFPKQAPGREEAEVGGSLTWATTARAGGYTWCLGSPSEPVPQCPSCLEGLTSTYKPLKALWQPTFRAAKQFGPPMQKMWFLSKRKGCIFTELTCIESLIYESTTRSENVPFFVNKAPTVY